MKLTFLGTGTSQGIPVINCLCQVCKSSNSKDNRLRTSAWLQTNQNSYLIDIGPDFRQQALKCGVSRIDAIFLTHEHADHTAGLDDIRPINFTMQKPMPLYGESRVIQDIKHRFSYIFGGSNYPGLPQLDCIEINPGQILEFNKDKIKTFRVSHGKLDILAYQWERLVYITDANFISEDIISQIQGCKLLVLNALRIKEHHSHYNLEQAIEMIRKIRPEKAYITHISHQLGFHAEIENSLPEDIHLAYDGLQIEY